MVEGTREFKGLWWLPGEEANKLAGTVSITEGAVALDLVGHFGNELLAETERQKTFSLDLAKQPRIIGTSTDGKPITLEGHQATSDTMSFPGVPTATYHRNVALIGKQFAEAEEIGFDEISIRASDLNSWTVISGFQSHFEWEQHHEKDQPVFSNLAVQFHAPEDVDIDLARGERASVRFTVRAKGMGGRAAQVSLNQEAALHLRFARRTELDEVFKRVIQIRNFLSLAVGRPVAILSVSGYQDDYLRAGTDAPRAIDLSWEIAYNPDPPKKARLPHEMLFTLPEAAPDISRVMKSWLAKQARLAPVFDLFFGVRHHADIPLEVRFLSYAQAIETYDYRRRRKPGSRTLAERVSDVLDECKTASARIVGSEPQAQAEFIEAFKTARNYYTHYNPRLERKAARGAALHLLFIQVQAIIEMSLLRELGFGCRSIEAILERVQRYAQIDHVKGVVASEQLGS